MHLSFEFFPPKNDIGSAQFAETLRDASALQPDFVSITCGAGGSAVAGTFATVKYIRTHYPLSVIPHIAYVRQTRAQLDEVLRAYKNLGVRQALALRGDPTSAKGVPGPRPEDTYAHTIDFVADLKNRYGIDPIVAAYPDVHPMAGSPQQDMDHLRKKVEAGAKRAISQFFFAPETFLRFRDKVAEAGIAVALTPGILPIHNLTQVLKFATLCGAAIPDGFRDRFDRHGDDKKALFEEGVAHATELCAALQSEGVTDFHFYTLNRSGVTARVCEALHLGHKRKQSA